MTTIGYVIKCQESGKEWEYYMEGRYFFSSKDINAALLFKGNTARISSESHLNLLQTSNPKMNFEIVEVLVEIKYIITEKL